MPYKEVKKTIAELKSELQKTPDDTTPLELKLDEVHEGFEHNAPESAQDLVRFLQNEVDQFEVEHPRITALMNQIMTSLSNIGI